MKAIPQKSRVIIKWAERADYLSQEGIVLSNDAQSKVMPIMGYVESVGDGNIAINGKQMAQPDLDTGDFVVFAPNIGVRFDDEQVIVLSGEYVYAKLFPAPIA